MPLIQRTLRNYDGDCARRDGRRLSAARAGRSACTIHFYSPVGLAAWIVDKFRSWSDCDGDIERRFTRDELLTCVSLYRYTRSMPSAVTLYWENRRRPHHFKRAERVRVPVGVAHFPREIPIPPRSYVERGYNVTRWTAMARGGHFAAHEEPDVLADDLREFTRPLRYA